MESDQAGIEGCLRALDSVAPGAPLLALGQTALWDEPMKAGVALALRKSQSARSFIAGVHDTDYFAKLPGSGGWSSGFKALPHNATTTRGLWSAAGEFSSLFGSETVISRHDFLSAGLNLEKVNRGRPGIFDDATEAYGWRGIVALGEDPPIVSELPLEDVLDTLRQTFQWAIDGTLERLTGPHKKESEAKARELSAIFDRHAAHAHEKSLSGFYKELLADVYAFVAGGRVDLNAVTTSELLRFNCETCERPRFELVGRFVHPETRDEAASAYNEALAGTEIYGLERFGSGATPFDLVIPGKGRGTLRIGNRALVIATPEPQFVTLKRPLRTVLDLAQAIEAKFGPDCVLIGKAVTLIGMLGREFVFVFHEGASSYVKHTRRFHDLLHARGIGLELNPILRIGYSPWDALDGCCSWIRLPDPFVRAFGAEELCAPSFAARWRNVCSEQEDLIKDLSGLRRPTDLIQFLDGYAGGAWSALSKEYEMLHGELSHVMEQVSRLKEERAGLYQEWRTLRQRRQEAERAKGRHFRENLFEKPPSAEALAERKQLADEVEAIIHAIGHTRERIHTSVRRQRDVVGDPRVLRFHERRREIELEAELKRMRLIRNAIVVSRGLVKAGHRPSAWWFPVLCPSGHWFKKTVESAACYLEPMSPEMSQVLSQRAKSAAGD